MGKLSSSLSLALVAAAVGCGSSDDETQPKQLEIYSWLTSGSEKAALDALLAKVSEAQPGIQITNAAQDRSDIAQKELPDHIRAGNPPDSFQVVGGAPLKEWIRQGALEPIDSLAAAQNWNSGTAFPPGVLDSVSKDGKIYAAPLNLERGNTLFYNKAMVTAAGFADGPTFENFFMVADAIKAQGKTALSVSAAGGWTITAALFDSILPAQAGPDFQKQYFLGQSTGDAQQMRDALTTLGTMMDYANADRMSALWTDAVKKVCSGDAAMLLLPDFVKGEFKTDGCDETMVGYVPMQPAATPTFIYVGMTWPLPVGAPHRDMGLEFLRITGSAEGQAAFNPLKGSIPARIDVDPSSLDPISQITFRDFSATGEVVQLGYPGATPSAFQEAAATAMKDFVDPSNANFKNVDIVLSVLRTQYVTLTQ